MRKALIISYYWPPSGGAGVQRWLKFVKYLPTMGWQPIVYTPSNPEFPSEDLSLLKDIPKEAEVLKTPIWEPYQLYKKFIGSDSSQKINAGFLTEKEKPKLTEKLSVWIRGNFFIPDARVFWVKPSVKYLSEYLEKNKVDVIISSGPPHSMHLIALELKEKYNIPWIADFRDPWTNIDFYKDLLLTSFADKKHHYLEKKVLVSADRVITVGDTIADEFKAISNREIEVITNGFDSDDTQTTTSELDTKFSIAHIGSLNKDRNPILLWEVLGDLMADNTFKNDLEIKLVGKIDIACTKALEDNGLTANVNKIAYLPHNEVIIEQQKSQVLLLLINNAPNAKGILTGKMFEYMAAKRPILCLGIEDGDAAKILNKSQAGTVVDFDNYEKLKTTILNYYSQYKSKNLTVNSEGIERYSRKNLTNELVKILNELTND
jgi:glycosyltransferase involved in cell wall biosynthesis